MELFESGGEEEECRKQFENLCWAPLSNKQILAFREGNDNIPTPPSNASKTDAYERAAIWWWYRGLFEEVKGAKDERDTNNHKHNQLVTQMMRISKAFFDKAGGSSDGFLKHLPQIHLQARETKQ